MMNQRQDPSQVQQPGQVDAANKTNATEAAKNVQKLETVQEAQKSDRVFLHKNGSGRVSFEGVARGESATKAETLITKLVHDMESGQKVMDKLIKAGMSGRDFSNSELISLQAGMYKYTQELELTGKVVEKATTGLKDTLRTQV
jgi:hypothetical protein